MIKSKRSVSLKKRGRRLTGPHALALLAAAPAAAAPVALSFVTLYIVRAHCKPLQSIDASPKKVSFIGVPARASAQDGTASAARELGDAIPGQAPHQQPWFLPKVLYFLLAPWLKWMGEGEGLG